MNKLQLYITRSGSGFKSLFNHNPNEDVRRCVFDLRQALSLVSYDVEEKNIFYMLSTAADGIFFTILRTIPPHPGHHLAAWIYIPNGLQISDVDLEAIVRLTTRKVSSAEVSQADVAALREAFNVEYPTVKNAPALTAGEGPGFAWRRYGGDTGLSILDFCGRGLFQQCYIPYAGVMLVDADLNCEVLAPDLTDVPLGNEAMILPPEKSGEGFEAHVFGRALDRPLRGTLDAPLQVVWKRPGFQEVTVDEIVDSPEFTPQVVSTVDSHKMITTASFLITSQGTHEPLEDCSIRVNGREITDEGREFTPEELRKASVLVSCEGYFPFSGTMDLASTTRALIQMKERRKIYRFELPVISSELGAPVKFEIHSKKPLEESPLEGYVLLDDIQEGPTRTNHLGFVGRGASLTQKLLYGAIGLVVGVLLTWLLGMCSRTEESTLAPAADPDTVVDTNVEVPAPVTEAEITRKPEPAAAAPAQKENSVSADAIRYLDDNNVWTREDLERFTLTKGLYDDMNSLDVERLISVWGPKLGSSKNFAKIVEHARMGQKKTKKAAPYNPAGDTRISVQGYLNRIDP